VSFVKYLVTLYFSAFINYCYAFYFSILLFLLTLFTVLRVNFSQFYFNAYKCTLGHFLSVFSIIVGNFFVVGGQEGMSNVDL